jgi:hypothetical protein
MALSEAALTLVATVETELGITPGSEPRLEGWVEDASAIIVDYLHRALHRQAAVVEKHKGDGSPYLLLLVPPINSVTSVKFEGATLAASDYEVDDAASGSLYFLGSPLWNTGYIGEGVARDPVAGTERKSYEATYDGGWITPRQAQSGQPYDGQTVTLPHAIQRACVLFVVGMKSAAARDPTVTNESLMNYSVGYGRVGSTAADDDEGHALPPGVAALLRPYRFIV